MLLGVPEDLPLLNIPWCEYDPKAEGKRKVTGAWNDLANMVTTEGESLWGQVIGLYGNGNKVSGFDLGSYFEYEDGEEGSDFFIPKELLDFGMDDIEYVEVKEDGTTFLVGADIQYTCTSRIFEKDLLKSLAELKVRVDEGKSFPVDFNTDKSIWKRAKIFTQMGLVKMVIKDGVITLSGHDKCWSEELGTCEASDYSGDVKTDLVERWCNKTIAQAVVVDGNGEHILYGEGKSGLGMYSLLAYSTISSNYNNDVEEAEDTSEDDGIPDVSKGGSLLHD